MKYSIVILFLCSLAIAQKSEMAPDQKVSISQNWWGEQFSQNGSVLKVPSMFPVLDAFDSSRDWARKSKMVYFPSFILAGGGAVMMVTPIVTTLFGGHFSPGMLIGGAVLTSGGLGLFKLSNVYLGRSVRGYLKEAGHGSSQLDIELGLGLAAGNISGKLSF